MCRPDVDDLNSCSKLYEHQFTSKECHKLHDHLSLATMLNSPLPRIVLPKVIVQSSSALVVEAKESSVEVNGAKIFNLIPPTIRNIKSEIVAHFKQELVVDAFLSEVPDQTTVAGYGSR
jgi:hypothetical protein